MENKLYHNHNLRDILLELKKNKVYGKFLIGVSWYMTQHNPYTLKEKYMRDMFMCDMDEKKFASIIKNTWNVQNVNSNPIIM